MTRVVAVVTAEDSSTKPPSGSWYVARNDTVGQPPQSWGVSHPSDRGLESYLCLFGDFHTESIATNDFVQRRADLMTLNP